MDEHTNQFNDAFMRLCYKKAYDIADRILDRCTIDNMFKYHINPICLTIVRVAADEPELMIKILDKIQLDQNIQYVYEFCTKRISDIWDNGSNLNNGNAITVGYIKRHLWHRMK